MNVPFPLLMGISSTISILCVIIFLLWYFKIRRVLNIRIMREYGDLFKVIMSKKLPFNTETFSYKKRTYIVDTTRSMLDGNNNPTLFYDQQNAKPILIKIPSGKAVADSKLLHTTLESDEYDKMMKTPRDKLNVMLFTVLVICIAGLTVFTMWREISHNVYVVELIQNMSGTVSGGGTFGG